MSSEEDDGPLFEVGEYYECRHRGHWYKVKVISCSIATEGPQAGEILYKVHYCGYNQRHDENVFDEQLRDMSERESNAFLVRRVNEAMQRRFNRARRLELLAPETNELRRCPYCQTRFAYLQEHLLICPFRPDPSIE